MLKGSMRGANPRPHEILKGTETMKCSCFSPLLKAINAYLQKADDDLEDELAAAGFADTDRTMNAIRSMEDFVAAAGEALDLQAFANDIWPGVRLNDQLAKKLTEIFKKRFTELMPGLVETYLHRTDTMLDVPRISKITTGWIETWSAKLGDMMQLNSHTELENILTEGLRNGDGIAVFTRKILDSGIRDEYYKARRVSVTEVLRAHNVAHQEAFMQSPSVIEKTMLPWMAKRLAKRSGLRCWASMETHTTLCTRSILFFRREKVSTAIASVTRLLTRKSWVCPWKTKRPFSRKSSTRWMTNGRRSLTPETGRRQGSRHRRGQKLPVKPFLPGVYSDITNHIKCAWSAKERPPARNPA